MLLHLVAVLYPLAGVLASFSPVRDGFDIRVREDGETTTDDGFVSPYCFPPCDVDSCNPYIEDGCEEPASGSSPSLSRGRSLFERSPFDVPWDTAGTSANHSSLYPRAPGLADVPWIPTGKATRSKVAGYLPIQAVGNNPPNPEYRRKGATYGWIVTDPLTEAAVGKQATFGKNLIQFASGGLHGCTVVTLVSKRAVWMAHFWETYSWGFGQKDTDRWDQNFDERVLQFIRRNAVPNPTNTKPTAQEVVDAMESRGLDPNDPSVKRPTVPDYIPPIGNGPNLNNFNKDDDQPYLWIMTPYKYNVEDAEATAVKLDDALFKKIRYERKVKQMIQTFHDLLPNLQGRYRLQFTVFAYHALNYGIPSEAAQENTNERGVAMFQYNPNAKGPGKRMWRLFYQQVVTDGQV